MSYSAPFSGYLSGSMSLEDTVNQLMEIQKKHQDAFAIQWKF